MAAVPHIRVALAIALLGVAVLVARPVAGADEQALVATASGDLRIANSAAGQAILDAQDLRPGDTTSGALTISNKSTAEQKLRLKTVGVEDTPGPGGGALSGHLHLVVERTTGSKVHEVYSGPVSALDDVDLGPLPSSQSQDYTFTATVPEGGPALDNAYAGATVLVAWRWEAVADVEPDQPAKPSAPSGHDEPAPPAAPNTAPPTEGPVTRPDPADDEGAPAGARPVRLWAAASPVQRLGANPTRGARSSRSARTSLQVLVRCRPGCTVAASAKVKLGRRWITLRSRSLGTVPSKNSAARLRFRLSGAEATRLRRALGRSRALPVRVVLRASARGHVRTQRTLALRLRR